MTVGSEPITLPGIAALPPTTAKQIGSGQVLADPGSVVKELIDNALDARAKSVFVDIAANTIDSIQVKDDGHGIPAEDRLLVGRRYCTSKIRDFHDLRNIGGKWLGFRGEALSSMAEMSGSIHVTTRVEGEPVAVRLTYDRNGELTSTAHESHPVGTTVKVTRFFDYIPVRKQTALKNSTKCLAKIRRLMQAYALARPTTRFRLHVLKAKNGNSDFVYAPKAEANAEDAALKVVGKDCALQCDWTILEADGFEINAFLPKSSADGSKISGHGAFVAVDGRPLSGNRGTIKQAVIAFKERLRKSNPSLVSVRDPFCFMSIICPTGSYDPNIEPAKDDVMFENSEVLLGVIERLLTNHYSQAIGNLNDEELAESAEQNFGTPPRTLQTCIGTSVTTKEHGISSGDDRLKSQAQPVQPRWRSTMYGIDEDDMEFLQDDQAPVIEEDDGTRAVEVSNPWTIARMNAAIKPKPVADNGQLLSPAKSQNGVTARSSSPNPSIISHQTSPVRSLTPQTSSRSNVLRSPLDEELYRSIQNVSEVGTSDDRRGERPVERRHDESMTSIYGSQMSNQIPSTDFQQVNLLPPFSSPVSRDMSPTASSTPKVRRKRQAYASKPFALPATRLNGVLPDQQFPGTQPPKPVGRQRRIKDTGRPFQALSNLNRSELETTERPMEPNTFLEDNSDIRDYFGRSRQPKRNGYIQGSSFTPINPQVLPDPTRDDMLLISGNGSASFPQHSPAPHTSPLPGLSYPSRMPQKFDLGASSNHQPPRNQTSAKEIAAYFLSHEQQQDCQARLASFHKPPSKTPKHVAERTKSSKLALERTPAGFQIHSLVVQLCMSLHSIIYGIRVLDMSSNTLEWGYPAEEAETGGFVSVDETTVMGWVVRLDASLGDMYERVGGVDTRGVLHESIQLGIRDEGRSMGKVTTAIRDSGSPGMCNEAVASTGVEAETSGDGHVLDVGRQQGVELGSGANDEEEPGECYDDDGLEDDMLLDL